MENLQEIMAEDIRKLKRAENEIQLNTRELIWANIFHDTIKGSRWLKKKNLKLGRAAIGYNFAYVLYRILDEIRPENILEIGLGESTHIIHQYAKMFRTTRHVCVEQNEEWVAFWKKSHLLSKRSSICCLPTETVSYKESDNVLVFKGFEHMFGGGRWNLIVVDGPLQPDCDRYRRLDILKILPEALGKDWIIIFDDFNREPDKNTIAEITMSLETDKIEYCKGIYKGKKDICVLCSPNLKYVTTM